MAVSNDGNWVFSGSKDRGVQFWDARSADAQLMLQGHKNSGMLLLSSRILSAYISKVMSVDLSPVGSMLATGSGDWEARMCAHCKLLVSQIVLICVTGRYEDYEKQVDGIFHTPCI